MNDIVIPEITISQQDLVNAVLLYLACLGVVTVASKYRKWLKAALWRKATIYWVLMAISVAILTPAIWETIKTITGNDNVSDTGPRRYVILLAAITGPLFIVWRLYTSRYQNDAAQDHSIPERIAKAMQSLETNAPSKRNTKLPPEANLKDRLGAIYSLERIAQESSRNHVKVMETLCAYVRNNSKAATAVARVGGNDINITLWREKIPPIRLDIQAAIDVIARRNDAQLLNEITEKYVLDFRGCNLQRVNFRQGKFDMATMEGSHLDFAQLKNAELNGVVLNQSTLNGADLSGARLNGAEMNGAKLNEAKLDQAEMNGAQCNGAELNGARLRLAKLNGAVLVGAKLQSADLNGAAINRAVANGADFSGAKLNAAQLKQAVLNRARFHGAELNGAELNKAVLHRAMLIGTELNGAKLDGADFGAAQTECAAIKSTDLSDTDRLSETQITSMFGDESTTLPAKMSRPKHWPEDDLDYSEFYMRWQVAKKEAGLP